MRVYIVIDGSGYIVGAFDSEEKARAARLNAEFNGVIGCYIQSVIMNETNED